MPPWLEMPSDNAQCPLSVKHPLRDSFRCVKPFDFTHCGRSATRFTDVDVMRCAALSQRHVLESAHELHSQEEELKEMLLEFFEQHLQEHFPETDYTFDVYITTAGRVRTQNALPNLEVNLVTIQVQAPLGKSHVLSMH